MFGGDDDDDFMPVSNSKLASIFSSKSTAEGNTSLTYTAPKQPKRGGSVKNESRSSTKTQTTGGSTVSSGAQPSPSNTLGIIIVKAVNTYKLEDGNYNLQGKLGAAVLGNTTVCVYQLLLYKGKQHHITSTKITPKFQYTVQENNYGTFYDEHKQNWSIHFDHTEDAEEFAKEIGLARGSAQGGNGEIQNLLTQDISTGEGPAANVGDSMEVFYSVRLFSDAKQGQLVESNVQAEKPQRVKIRKNVWEEGLIGAKKGSKRIILLPPSLVGPWKQEVPLSASLVVEVEVSRLKQAKGSREGTPSALTSLVDSGESAVDSSTDETSIRARGASISEALTASPKTHKANIISRMAKMGQATLPLKGAIVCNPSDSDSENEANNSSKPPIIFKPSPKVRSPKSQSKTPQLPSPSENPPSGSSMPHQQMTMYQPHPGWQQQPQAYTMSQYASGQLDGQLYSVMPNQTISSHQLIPTGMATTVGTPPGMASADSHLSVFLSETRTHNTEVRIGMAKVADKVDQVLAKLDSVHSVRPSVSSGLLDSSTLLASIQKLVSENEQLKTELVEKGNKIEIQNDRIYQLLNTNHKYLEQSSASSGHEALIVGLKQEKIQLLEDLSNSKEKLQNLQVQLENYTKEKSEASSSLANQLANQREELAKSKCVIEEQNASIQRLTEKLKNGLDAQDCHEKTIATLRTSMLDMQSYKDKLTMDLSEVTHQLNLQKIEADEQVKILNAKYSSQIATLEMREVNYKKALEERKNSMPPSNKLVMEEVKRIMNLVYKTLRREFVVGETYLGEDIKETLLSTIRDITCQLVEQETFATSIDVKAQTVASGSSKASTNPIQETETHPVMGTSHVASSMEQHSDPEVSSNHYHHELRDGANSLSTMSIVEPSDVNTIEDSADGPKDNNDSLSSVVENCVGGNAGDIPTVPLTKLPGETDLTLKLASTNSETLEESSNHLRVTSDSCVLGSAPTRVSDDSRRESTSAVIQDSMTRPPTTDTVAHADHQQLSTNDTQETIDRNPRDSSLERKPWRSEPPPAPLFDDDEDEDDWLS